VPEAGGRKYDQFQVSQEQHQGDEESDFSGDG